MIAVGPLGILGGTFDPIHFGHLRLGEEALQQLSLEQIRFIPAGQPPLRESPCASAVHRLAMAKLAIAGNPRFEVDEGEVTAAQQSYSVDTLARLRREVGPTRPLVLLLGTDAFNRLEQWHQWQEIFTLAHIAVANRPQAADSPVGADETTATKTTDETTAQQEGAGQNPARFAADALKGGRAKDALFAVADDDTPLECTSALASELIQRRGTATDLALAPSGRIVSFTIPALDISATTIRRLLKAGCPPRYLVADSVVRYIDLHHLYL